MTTFPSIWDDPQRIADLKQLASEGFSSGQIAKDLGISRNAVIGKLRRLDIPLLNPPNGAPNSKASPRVRKSTTLRDIPPRQQIAPEAPPMPYDGIGVSILELTSETCRWPLGEPSRTGFHFCGATPKNLSPYCCEHAALATR